MKNKFTLILSFVLLLIIMDCSISFSGKLYLEESHVIYKKNEVYASFPSFFNDNGVLVVSFSTRTTGSHYDNTGGGKTLISKDQGKSWIPLDRPRINPIFNIKSDEFIVPSANSWRVVDSKKAKELEEKGVEVKNSNNKLFYATGAKVSRTSDHGKTFRTKEVELPPHSVLMGYNHSAVVKTSSSDLLSALYGKFKQGDIDQVFILKSSDNGEKWVFNPMLQATQFPAGIGFNETALLELRNKNILAVMRSNPPGFLYSSVSKDNGTTWSTPKKMKIRGYPANLILLPDGKVLCTYGYRQQPLGIRAAIISDNLVDLEGDEIVIRSDGKGNVWDVGYPVSNIIGNTIYVVYYITDQDGDTRIDISKMTYRKD